MKMKAIVCDTLNKVVLEVLEADDPALDPVYAQPNRSILLFPEILTQQGSEVKYDIIFEYCTESDRYVPKFAKPKQPTLPIPVTTISSNSAPTSEEDSFL